MFEMNKPKISIVMPMYNSSLYLAESIESVLNQSYSDFEFLIIDDGSTDDSSNIVLSYKDERIILVKREHDFIASLNYGLEISRGKYIARMDADDIMHRDRLLIQNELMDTFPNIDFCSSWITFFNKELGVKQISGKYSGFINNPLVCLLQNNCFPHPSMMIRKQVLKKNNLKYKYYNYAEDYKLWFDAAKCGLTFFVEPQSLLYYRCHSSQISSSKSEEQMSTTNIIKKEIVDYILKNISADFTTFVESINVLEKNNHIDSMAKYDMLRQLLLRNNILI